MRHLLLVTAIVLLASFALAEDKLPPKVVKVTGTSDVKVTPDRAVINIGVEKQNVSATLAKKAADAAAREILSVLLANAIEEKDIQTTYLSLSPQYDYRNGKVTYFVAEQNLTVTVRNLSKVDALLQSLVQAGGNRISSIQYETSDLRQYRDQARDMAVRAATEKAQALAKALGQSIGKAYSIEELSQSANPYYGVVGGLASNSSYEDGGQTRGVGPSTAAGQKKVTASVIVWFELLPD